MPEEVPEAVTRIVVVVDDEPETTVVVTYPAVGMITSSVPDCVPEGFASVEVVDIDPDTKVVV